jgi:transposase
MGILSKSTIEKWIIPNLTVGERGFEPTVPVIEIVECIFYRLKTGCQWRELPTKQFFSGKVLGWNAVYYHFNQCGAARAVKRWLLVENLDKYFERK